MMSHLNKWMLSIVMNSTVLHQLGTSQVVTNTALMESAAEKMKEKHHHTCQIEVKRIALTKMEKSWTMRKIKKNGMIDIDIKV